MSDPVSVSRRLIDQMLAITGLSPTGLAKKGRLAVSTLTRFLNGETPTAPTMRTIVRLSDAAGVELRIAPTAEPQLLGKPMPVDPEMLRLALLIALRNMPEDEPHEPRECAWLCSLVYDALAEQKEETGAPITEESEAFTFAEILARRFLAARRR